MEIYLKELTLAGDLYWREDGCVVFLVETDENEDVQPYVCECEGYVLRTDGIWRFVEDWKLQSGRMVRCEDDCPFWERCQVDRYGSKLYVLS